MGASTLNRRILITLPKTEIVEFFLDRSRRKHCRSVADAARRTDGSTDCSKCLRGSRLIEAPVGEWRDGKARLGRAARTREGCARALEPRPGCARPRGNGTH